MPSIPTTRLVRSFSDHSHTQFLGSWDDFVGRFGARGPLEMDVASPRYGDRSQLALRQMSFMTADDERFSP